MAHGQGARRDDLDSGGGSPLGDEGLYEAASGLVDRSRDAIARHANAVVSANWRLGHLVDTEILQRGRAEYGQQIVATLWHQLSWSHVRLRRPAGVQGVRPAPRQDSGDAVA